MNHWLCIVSSDPRHRTYHGMPFEADWDSRQGGRFIFGMLWIIQHLGYRADWARDHHVPENRVSLHIKNHARGFVKGNLTWATIETQSAEKMRGVIAKQNAEIKRLRAEVLRLKQYQGTIDKSASS